MYEYRLKAWALKDFTRSDGLARLNGTSAGREHPALSPRAGDCLTLHHEARAIHCRVRCAGPADSSADDPDLMTLVAPVNLGDVAYLPGSWLRAVEHFVTNDHPPLILVLCRLGGAERLGPENGLVLTVGDLEPGRSYDLLTVEDLAVLDEVADVAVGGPRR